MAAVKNIWTLLRNRYPANEYALMAEVSDASGFHRSNSADYIAVNLWPSRGLAINGIELKSFRSDWQNELRKPAKAENIFKYCDYFWLLTSNDTIANIEEIPVAWGWLCVYGNRIKVKKDAPKLTPIPLDKHFMCAMLKRAADKTSFVHIDSIEDKINEAKESSKLELDRENKRKLAHADGLQNIISEFEKASGIKFGNWNGLDPKKVGEAAKLIQEGGIESIQTQLKALKRQAEAICNRINEVLEK